MLKSFSTIAGIATLLLIGGLFVLLRTTAPAIRTSQSTEANPVAASDTPAGNDAGFAPVDSPLPTPTVEPTPESTPTAQPYPDLKVVAVQRVATGPYLGMLWSPDGTKAVLSKHHNIQHIFMKTEQSQTDIRLGDLWLLDAASGAEKLLLEKVGRYTWSPDSTKIALINPSGAEGIDGELLIYDLASGQTTVLVKADFLGSDYEPQWLPSNEIIFVREGQLWMIGADGSNEHSLPNFKFLSMTRQPNVILHQGDPDAVITFDFSPDGKKVAYMAFAQTMDGIANRLWVSDINATPTLITEQAIGFSWSPNSEWLYLLTYRDINDKQIDAHSPPERHIWLVAASNLAATEIYKFSGWGGPGKGVWSPDSTKIAFVQQVWGEEKLSTSLWLVDASADRKIGPLPYTDEQKDSVLAVWWDRQGSALYISGETSTDKGTELYTNVLTLTK